MLSARMPVELVQRLDALVERLGGDPAYLAFKLSRSSLLRLAVQRGIEALEAEHPMTPPGKAAKPSRADR